MSAASQRVLRACGWTGGGNSPNAAQRQTVRALMESRLATSRTVSRSGFIGRNAITTTCENRASIPTRGWECAFGNFCEHTEHMYMLQERKKHRQRDRVRWHVLAEVRERGLKFFLFS
jgi:hypothetical protein